MQKFKLYPILLLTLLTACEQGLDTSEQQIEVPDYRHLREFQVEVQDPQPRDVEVFRVKFAGDCYAIRFYRMENGSLLQHKVFHCNPLAFDRAYYSWVDDKTLDLKLENSQTGDISILKVYGEGAETNLIQ